MKLPLLCVSFLALFSLVRAESGSAKTAAPAPDLANNPAPVVTALDPKLPTIFIAGDSTAAKSNGNPIQGWAVPFADYFDATKVNVANRARGGRSSRTYITEGLWDGILADLKAGDFVHTLGDAHLYLSHLEQARLQLTREPRPLPVMKINPDVKSIFDFKYEDFELTDYNPYPHIDASVSV